MSRTAVALCVLLLLAVEPIHAGSVVVTEVMANPNEAQGGQKAGEFVELFNPGDEPVDLKGWQIADRDAKDVLVPFVATDSAELAPHSFAVILDPDYDNQYAIPDGTLRLKPTNASIGNGLSTTDPIRLFDANGTLQDTFTPPTAARSGVSFERINIWAADAPENWQLSTDATGTTIGRETSPPKPKPSAQPQPPAAGIVVVNEIMFRPKTDAPEWVELHNGGDVPVLMQGWTISDARNLPVEIPSAVFPAKAYILLTRSADELRTAHPNLPLDTVVLEIALPTLNDTGDTVAVNAGDSTSIDTMTYGSLDVTPGQSLERREPGDDSARLDNWRLSVSQAGSTPGLENSVRHDTGERPVLDASPNPFDPSHGALAIRYEAPISSTVTLRIFNSAGVLVRVLASESPYSGRQSMEWNGKNDAGESVPTGIYIIQLLAVSENRPRAAALAIVVSEP